MWVMLNNSFLSIVENRDNSDELLVRARIKGDIERVFENAAVFEVKPSDYKYRAFIDREDVQKKISKQIRGINYDNFKDSVSKTEVERLDAYIQVWSALQRIQK
jgi:hypothetical protein|tara:strand:- start:1 stop:312 length:312 start_codon:yes stop_codon:yes gene_type:complete